MDNKHDLKSVVIHYGGKVSNTYGWKSIKCVIHDDKMNSASINVSEQIYYCFVCDFHGDVYDIIMKKEGGTLKDAIARAEGITNGVRGPVSRSNRRKDSLLPKIKRNRPENRRYIPTRYS
jgi:DNA primase